MNESDKKVFAYIGLALFVIITLWYDFVSSADEGVKALIAFFIILIAGCFFIFFNLKAKDTSMSSKMIEKMTDEHSLKNISNESPQATSIENRTEKDYLKQIADDIHLIKIIILVFAAVSVLSVLGILIYMVSIFSQLHI